MHASFPFFHIEYSQMILAFICNVNETLDKDDKDAGRPKSAIPYFTSGHFHLLGSSVSTQKAHPG